MIDADKLNGANLAYIGDAYYELIVRERLLSKGITKSNDLTKEKVKYVSAKNHDKIFKAIEKNLTEEEIAVFKRGRNHKYHRQNKSSTIGEYLNSSGFEAIIGYLFLKNKKDRLNELIEMAFDIVEGENNE